MAKKKAENKPIENSNMITKEMIDHWNATDTNSITYTTEQFERWVKEGKIPKELANFKIMEMEKMMSILAEEKALGKNPTEQQILEIHQKHERSLEDSKKFVEFQKFILSNKESLLKIIEGAEKKKKYRQSAHYVEQKLRYDKPNSNQMTIFDILCPETVEKIKDESIQYVGIRLSPPEDRLVNAITRLLAKKSQITDYKSEDFYMGNEETKLVSYGSSKEKSARLRFKKHELLTEFYSTKKVSGADIKYFERVFNSFIEKKWLIRYKRTVQEGKENKHFIVEDYLPLVRIIKYYPNLSDTEAKKVENGDEEFRMIAGEYLLALNPIITDQIDQKYIEFPMDIDYRTKIAAGSHLSVSEAIILLRDWLISEMSAGRYESEINEENLLYKLRLDKHIRTRKKDRLHQQLSKAIQVSRHLGIILDVEEATGSVGQKKYIFRLNKDFE